MTVTLCHLLYKKENPAQKTKENPAQKTNKKTHKKPSKAYKITFTLC